MSYILIKDGKPVIRDGAVVLVPNASGNEDCECCGDLCTGECSTTSQGDVTVSYGGADTGCRDCATGATSSHAYTFNTFGSNAYFCVWSFTYNTAVSRNIQIVHNPTASNQTWGLECGVTIAPGEWYIVLSCGAFCRWNKNSASVTCSGGQLSFSATLTACDAICGCGVLTVSK